MSTHDQPHRELPSTYFVQDRENLQEMARQQIQGQIFTASMGGVLPEQPDPTTFRRVLDVGCGPGNWLIEAAKTYPGMSLLVGADVSNPSIAYAREQAAISQVNDRVEFHAMDALLMLEFPNNYFDLVNQRLASSWIRTWDWPKLLSEYKRVCRPGGVIRITEFDYNLESTSPALNSLNDMCLHALYQAGHYMTPEGDAVISNLAPLLRRHGVQDVQTRALVFEYRAGTPEGKFFIEDMTLAYRNLVPFIRKWTRIPDDYQTIYQQALTEMQQPDFVGRMGMLTAWGTSLGYVPSRVEY
jgi:ubiquinone/menaquinone biosynthesis C-methylase UbiE